MKINENVNKTLYRIMSVLNRSRYSIKFSKVPLVVLSKSITIAAIRLTGCIPAVLAAGQYSYTCCGKLNAALNFAYLT